MNPHWENNKVRETTVATHILKDLIVTGKQKFFSSTKTFFTKSTFHHNLYVMLFPFVNTLAMYWSIRQNPIFQEKWIFSFEKRIFYICCNRFTKEKILVISGNDIELLTNVLPWTPVEFATQCLILITEAVKITDGEIEIESELQDLEIIGCSEAFNLLKLLSGEEK